MTIRRALGIPVSAARTVDISPPFLFIGGDVFVRSRELVAILDQHALAASPTREFIGLARRRGHVEDAASGLPVKAAVVCARRVILSSVSSATLRRRAGALHAESGRGHQIGP